VIAAIYAQKSTEQNVAEDAKSVMRQVDVARAFAVAHGWTVDAEHVYVDDGISGAEFDDRPGLARLLLTAKTRPRPFDVLVRMDESRLGRDQWRTGYLLSQFKDAGLGIWYYQANRQANLADATGQFMENVYGYAAQMEREKAAARARETGRVKAAKGHVAGGVVFGYRNVRADDHVDRVIVDREADVIRRIFREISEGRGYAKIAQGLNADAIPCSRGRRWAMTCVREMVFRELYRGRIVYGRTRWQDKGGRPVKVRTPESEWIIREAPALRIVPEDLWQAAHERLDRTRQTYLRSTGGKLWGRPESGIEARHLLTGFVTCGCCGGACTPSSAPAVEAAPSSTSPATTGASTAPAPTRSPCPCRHSTPWCWPRSSRTC
jgi:DNA invertase Pin-like site-specific DNA recombinase